MVAETLELEPAAAETGPQSEPLLFEPSKMRRRSVTFAEHSICPAASNQPLHLQHEGAPHLPENNPRARRTPARSKSSVNLGTLQMDDTYDPASMRTLSSCNLGVGHRRQLSEDSGRYQAKGSTHAAASPFKYADSSYLPEPFADSPWNSSRKQGSRLSTVLSWKLSKRSSASSQVVGGPEQEPGALGYGRSGTWDQISPHSESPNLTISRRSSYAASSTDEAHSQGCVAQQQQTAHAYVAQSQLTEQQEYKRPPATVRSQPQLAGPRAYLMRSVSAGHRSSSRPVCTREAPSMGCVAQQSSPRSAGSVGSGSASRRASYVAGCVFEAGATTQGRPAMPTMQDQLKALLSQNCGAPGVSMPSSQGSRSRRSSLHCVESMPAAVSHAASVPSSLPSAPPPQPSAEQHASPCEGSTAALTGPELAAATAAGQHASRCEGGTAAAAGPGSAATAAGNKVVVGHLSARQQAGYKESGKAGGQSAGSAAAGNAAGSNCALRSALPQKPAALEGRPKGWKALSFTKSKLFRSIMP
uniref:Uncharacterized protein n=1 Tax=Dunaliella tertiolecta TaxID=3047 RepID=A0A7S3R806_DUNTE